MATDTDTKASEMIESLPVIELPTDKLAELTTVGEFSSVNLRAMRAGEASVKIAEYLKSRFDAAPDVYSFRIEKVGIDLTPEQRADVRIWLEEHVPLGSDTHKWDVRFIGTADGFELKIAKRPKRMTKAEREAQAVAVS